MSKSARQIFEDCHRDWRGFWPRGFGEDLAARLESAGYVVVPKEPTDKMQCKGAAQATKVYMTRGAPFDSHDVVSIYKAMLQAKEAGE